MERTFYFLRDSVTGKFYTGQSNTLDDFAEGAVYYQEKNAKKKIKDIILSWEHDQNLNYEWVKGNFKHLISDSYEEYLKAAMLSDAEVKKRKDLKSWGIEIVHAKVSITK